MAVSRALLFFTLFSFLLQALFVASMEFEVGGKDGWIIPQPKNGEEVYNRWASENRFKVNDTLSFKYKNDSVMEVTEAEYEKCKSSKPIFFSNNGDTSFTLDRPGLYYFISGVSGHCERGQKMIVKVLGIQSPPPTASQNSIANGSSRSSTTMTGIASIVFALPIFFRPLLL